MEGLKYNNKYFINHIVIVILFLFITILILILRNIVQYYHLCYIQNLKKLYILLQVICCDGSIQYNNISIIRKPKGNAKYGMTMDTYSLNYLNHLYENVYGQFSLSGIYPYPNTKLPQHS